MLIRYIVNDVEETIAFYTSKLGFELKKNFAPAVAFLGHGDLTLLVSGAMASASARLGRVDRCPDSGQLIHQSGI